MMRTFCLLMIGGALFGTQVIRAQQAPVGGEAETTTGAGETQDVAEPTTTTPDRESKLTKFRTGTGPRSDYPLNGIYIAAQGGTDLSGTQSNSLLTQNAGAGNPGNFETDSENDGFGFLAGIKLGYQAFDKEKSLDEFQIVRAIELEANYQRFDTNGTGNLIGTGTTLDTEFELITVTANGLLKFRNKFLTPTIGIGGGLGHLRIESAEGTIIQTNPPFAMNDQPSDVTSNSEFVPVVLGIVGLERDLGTPHVTLFLEYKPTFIPSASFDFKTTGVANADVTSEFENILLHNMQMGLRYNF